MKLHHLKPAPGSRRDRKRVGRGKAAGQGKTAGRGTKGWGARHQPKQGFEGGQMPLARRLAKAYDAKSEVDPDSMVERGLVRGGAPVKVLARGDIDRALTVRAHAFSA